MNQRTTPRDRARLRPPRSRVFRAVALFAGGSAALIGAVPGPAAAAVPGGVVAGAARAGDGSDGAVRSVQEIDHQDVAPAPGSEPDTLVEPDVAVSPRDPRVAVAAAHDGRYPDGGAVGISHAWTRDGGRTWNHAPVPGLTLATGGSYERASDPVLAFGPDGTAYLSTLAIDFSDCRSAVLVSVSRDGGATFAAPVAAHASSDCNLSDDKNWIAVDGGPLSPHRGRIYQFWTAYTLTAGQQWVTWSDDHGAHWSTPVVVTPGDTASTQDSQVLIHPDGAVTDVYLDYEGLGQTPDRERPQVTSSASPRPSGPAAATRRSTTAAGGPPGIPLRARTSRDGGRTWSDPVTVTTDSGGDLADVRANLPSGAADPFTGGLYVVWESPDDTRLLLSRSWDGRHWSAPTTVNRHPSADVQLVNADVTARAGQVTVSYGLRDTTVESGRYVQQWIGVSDDLGFRFDRSFPVGPRSDLTYSAISRGHFPGDYIGTATAPNGWVYAVWARSSTPPTPGATYHQVLEGAVLRP